MCAISVLALTLKSPASLAIEINYKWLFRSLCFFQHFHAERCCQGWEEHDSQHLPFQLEVAFSYTVLQ